MDTKETKLRRVMSFYKERSRSLFESKLDDIIDYMVTVAQDEEISRPLKRFCRGDVGSWVSSQEGRNYLESMYKNHSNNFEMVFFESINPSMAELARGIIGFVGLNFDEEAKELRDYLDSKLDQPEDVVVDKLLAERGLYPARAITGHLPSGNILNGGIGMLEYFWMYCADKVCSEALQA